MTNVSKEEKRMMLFDMQEHPEKYTDEQVEHLLADEEVKEFFHELAMARMAGKKANPKEVDVDGAWKKFVQAHHEGKMEIDAGKSKDAYRNRMKIAASIVGIIFLLAIPSAIFEDDFEIGDHLIGAMIISVPFFIIGEFSRIFIKKKYGEDFRGIEIGDTILMIAAGALLGTQAVIVSALLGIIVCAIIGIIHYMATGDKTVAFGPGLAIGIAISALWGNQIANWYLGMLVVEETVS